MNKETQKIIISLKKARSLSDKIISMVEDGHYCIDIMQQNLAVIGLFKSAHQLLLERHLNTCFKDAVSANDQKRQKKMIEEILKVNNLVNR